MDMGLRLVRAQLCRAILAKTSPWKPAFFFGTRFVVLSRHPASTPLPLLRTSDPLLPVSRHISYPSSQQHDARFYSDTSISPFNVNIIDNAAGGGGDVEATARCITVSLDTDAMTATLVYGVLPGFNITAASQGYT
jgi:hypothetical protein